MLSAENLINYTLYPYFQSLNKDEGKAGWHLIQELGGRANLWQACHKQAPTLSLPLQSPSPT